MSARSSWGVSAAATKSAALSAVQSAALSAAQTRRTQPHPAGRCRGAVTAEFAVALPAAVLLLAVLLAGSAAGVTQLRFEEAARSGARALARGAGAAEIESMVRRLAGPSARSTVGSDGDWMSVTVSGRVPGTAGSLLPWSLEARVWTLKESPAAGETRVRPDRPQTLPSAV